MQFNISKKEIMQMAAVMAAAAVMAIIVYVVNRNGVTVESLSRRASGEGSYTEELEVSIEGQEEEAEVQVDVAEQKYAEDTVERRLEEAAGELEKLILGKNESCDDITDNLDLISQIPDTGIQVSWTLNDLSVIDTSGALKTEAIPQEGANVTITATLSYGEHERVWEKELYLCAPVLTEEETLQKDLQTTLEERQSDTETEESLILPTEVDGKTISWKRKKENTAIYILLAGVVLSVSIPAKRIQEERQLAGRRRRELEAVYPDLVQRFQLYVGAGMSVRNAFFRLEEDYRKERNHSFIQEEIGRLVREMSNGVPEAQCYEAFGKRCMLPAYRKFGTILSQNLRKGTRGMRELLQRESEEAFEERKALARRKGEEAGTKLLFPMFLMLGTIMFMIIVPAFMSMEM